MMPIDDYDKARMWWEECQQGNMAETDTIIKVKK